MAAPRELFNPYVVALSISVLALVILCLSGLLFALALAFWRLKNQNPQQNFKHYLTGLPNRSELMRNLNDLIAATHQGGINVGLLYIDLDDFNNINNSLGNEVGNKLLQHIGQTIATVGYKYSKYVYHIGSDEFAIIVFNYGKDINVINEIANDIIHDVATPINIDGYELHCSCAVGICVYPECAENAEVLLKNASVARDNAKKEGYGSHSLYTQEMSKKSAMRSLISADLRLGLSRNEFYLQYQPMVSLEDGQVHTVEALLRWRHESLGHITPDIFVPAIEDLGLIHSIGKWVIYTACKEIVKLQAAGYPDLCVAINVSAHQFNRGDIATIVAEAIWETGIPAANVEIELTEAVVMADTEKSVLMLTVLKAMGVKIAVDDFGTGYSSMNQLSKFPISVLKIDRCFIRDIDTNPTNQALVSTMIRLGQQLGYKVVGEGVDTDAELEILRKEGCDMIQGFYFSKPLSMADLTKYLETTNIAKAKSA